MATKAFDVSVSDRTAEAGGRGGEVCASESGVQSIAEANNTPTRKKAAATPTGRPRPGLSVISLPSVSGCLWLSLAVTGSLGVVDNLVVGFLNFVSATTLAGCLRAAVGRGTFGRIRTWRRL
jgi:hypothetical protein